MKEFSIRYMSRDTRELVAFRVEASNGHQAITQADVKLAEGFNPKDWMLEAVIQLSE